MEDKQLRRVTQAYRERFSGEPRVFRAPGRVNLIGEHTDYNEGFVMPFAIDRETHAAGVRRSDREINVAALDVIETVTIDLTSSPVKGRGTWVDYVEGIVRVLQAKTGMDSGADLVFSSTVPIGGGLSSSAALEVSIGLALLTLAAKDIDKEQLAFAAQSAEHEFVGIRSGIMDQFTSVFSKADHAMLLDCRSLERKQIPLAIEGTKIVVCDTGVKHELASSEYNRRREECEEGVEQLKKSLPDIISLRDVTSEDLDRYGCNLSATIARRCRHVVTENERTLAAANALTNGDAAEVGKLMYESHRSLRDDYQVSSPELDTLVDAASRVNGVFGARMTGGGFGGCTVNLISAESFEEFQIIISERYAAQFEKTPEIYVFQAADGASEIRL
jgi:galactokinase